MFLRTATENEIQEIFKMVDTLVPLDVQKRIKLGERLAQERGITLYERVETPNRIFNPWVKGLYNGG